MAIKSVGIMGAGSMGHGIAQVAAQAGYDVVMADIEDRLVDGAIKKIDKFLNKSVEKGKISAEQKNGILAKIKGTTKVEDLESSDFIVEVVPEEMELKKKVFQELDKLARKEVIIATNTSSLSVTEIAASTSRPDKVAGLHFFNPVPLMRLVEVIRGHYTSDETVKGCIDMARSLGKEPIEVHSDIPGFVVNRLMIPHLMEAINLYQSGVASVEDIDKAAKLGLNYPMGPFELMDLTGIDIAYHVVEYLHKELDKDLKWTTPRLLRQMVRANRLGVKTGAGWYSYRP
ncbi:MAG: putative 3-hydroxybutyryl-CoA dehydrogenase [Syntrophorhabdaceae bacterium PtaU1.Bin034]|nr:MAG: putative 3-hydroxybutyryl-CoA dehydrogenase [Syntrophorhabdaceae bacterium PtaU1.Bin034]